MFPLHVLAADKPFYEGDCESLVVPTLDGEYGVLAGHCNTILAIVPGTLTFRTAAGETCVAAVAAGIMKVENGEALVLVDSALRPEDIDAERQRRKADEAKEQLLQQRRDRKSTRLNSSHKLTLIRIRLLLGFGRAHV